MKLKHFFKILQDPFFIFRRLPKDSFKLDYWDKVFIFILVIFFVLKLFAPFDHFTEAEINRDYLVAHHIVAYNELPLYGHSSSLGPFSHSPFYHYFLAGFLFLNDSILFLRFVNIVLQFLGVVFLYILAKKMFGGKSAFIACLLYIVSQRFAAVAQFPVHPVFSQPFIILSLLLLLLFHEKKNYFALIGSVFFFVFAVGLNQGPLLLMPGFVLIVFLALKQKNASAWDYFGTAILMGTLLLLFWAPEVLIYFQTGQGVLNKPTFLVQNFYEWAANFVKDANLLLRLFFFHNAKTFFSLNLLLLVGFLSGLFLYFYAQKDPKKRVFFFLILALVLQPIIFLAFSSSQIYAYHFIPVLGLFAILISECFGALFREEKPAVFIQIVVVLALVKIFSADFSAITNTSQQSRQYYSNIRYPVFKLPGKDIVLENLTDTITERLEVLRQELAYKDWIFFQVRFYRQLIPPQGKRTAYPYVDAVFWAPLEERLKTKLVRVSQLDYKNYPYRYFSFTPLNRDDFIFLVCERRMPNQEENCLKTFLDEYEDHALEQKIHEQANFVIYLTRRKSVF